MVVEEEAAFTRESITNRDPPNAQQAQHQEGKDEEEEEVVVVCTCENRGRGGCIYS